MKSTSILLVLAVLTGAGRGAQEGGCGRAGALRCDADGRHLSACTKGGAWRRVLDCGASHAACVNGRCVGGASARAEECSTPGEWGCSSDCTYRTYCTANNVWTEISPCPQGYICYCGECVNSATKTCKTDSNPICGQGSVGHFFPVFEDCSQAYYCQNEGQRAQAATVCVTDPDLYYQPCSGDCISTSTLCGRYRKCDGNEGLDDIIPGNPTLHYICADGTMYLMKCDASMIYDPSLGECYDAGMDYCSDIRMDISIFSKIVRIDECSSTDGSTTISSRCIVGDQWADLNNECKFYYCYPPGEPIHMTCPAHTKYDAAAEECAPSSGSCLR